MQTKYNLFADMGEKDKIHHLVVKESNQDYVHVSDDNKMHIDFKTLSNYVVNKTCKWQHQPSILDPIY